MLLDCANNVYVADSGHNAIIVVLSNGTKVPYLSDGGTYPNPVVTIAKFKPTGVAADCCGNVYVTDSSGVVYYFSGGPLSVTYETQVLNRTSVPGLQPVAVATGPSNSVYVLDGQGNGFLYKIFTNGSKTTLYSFPSGSSPSIYSCG